MFLMLLRHKIIIQDYIVRYIALCILITLFADLFGGDAIGITYMFKIVVRFIPCVLIYNLYLKNGVPKLLYEIPIVYCVLASIGAILLSVGTIYNWNILTFKSSYYIEAAHGNPNIGFLFGIIPLGNFTFSWRRCSNFFLEPSNFAAFLMIGILWSYGFYKKYKKRIYLFASVICIIGFLLAGSRAGYVAMIGTLIFAISLKSNRRRNFKFNMKYFIRIAVGIVLFVVLSVILLRTMVFLGNNIFTNNNTFKLGIYDAKGNVSLLRPETTDIPYIVSKLQAKPLGYGFSILSYNNSLITTNLANAFVMWLLCGGIIGGVGILYVLFFVFKKYCFPCLTWGGGRMILWRG